jgi:hypothetical protein
VPATQLLDGPAAQSICARGLRIELEPLLQRQWSSYSGRDAGALSACAHALLAVQNTPDFASGMLRVLDEPQPGVSPALQGALAGAHYGVEAVPAVWRRVLRSHAQVTATLARRAS